MRGTTRRQFLQGALGAGGALLLGCNGGAMLGEGADAGPGGDALPAACPDPFARAARLGTLPFVGEGNPPLDVPFGAGLDGRLYHDLAMLDAATLVTPNDSFYIRTRYPDLLDPNAPWKIAVGGLVKQPRDLALADLASLSAPRGVHLMECSGNGAGAHFGLLSAAPWSGAPLLDVLALVEALPRATRVLVSGFDMYSMPSTHSIPGASWIFTFQQLADSGAFLATGMNGAPLPKDHGAPVRLLVPRWYGCTCIKWVNEIRLVDDSEPATGQMKEFAGRTMQNGVPDLARDYLAASMDQAAMPVRVEKWQVDGAIAYRVVGVMWGGYRVTDKLQIRFNPTEPFVPVDVCPAQATNETWTLWSHAWRPTATGPHAIALRVDDPQVPTRRLDVGHYVRTVQVDTV